MTDRAVIAVVDTERIVLGVTGGLEGGHEELVLFRAAEHVVLRVDREDRRQGLPDIEGGRGFVARDGVAWLATFFTDRVVGQYLRAHLGDAGNGAKGKAVGFQAVRVHADEQGERGASGVAADEDLAWVATMFGDVFHCPGEGRRGIIDVSGVLDLRAQAVVRRDHRDTGLGEAFADFGAVFRS